jgi:hypothetical protein
MVAYWDYVSCWVYQMNKKGDQKLGFHTMNKSQTVWFMVIPPLSGIPLNGNTYYYIIIYKPINMVS